MDKNKIRVAITQGETNGVGFELIFKAFSEPEMLELCTPIIYGLPKVAIYNNNLQANQLQFNIIKHADEAQAGKINLVSCSDENRIVEFGNVTKESIADGIKALDKALADGRHGKFDVLVCSPISEPNNTDTVADFNGQKNHIETSFSNYKALEIFLNDKLRIVSTNNDDDRNVSDENTLTNVLAKIKALHHSLKRDFLFSNPRIAIIVQETKLDAKVSEALKKTITAITDEGIQVFGPYNVDEFAENRSYEAFDGILSIHGMQEISVLTDITDDAGMTILTEIPKVCIIPSIDSQANIHADGTTEEALVRNAIYKGIDIYRARLQYDKAYLDPLPKLYRERPDNGEKLRFSIPKKKEE